MRSLALLNAYTPKEWHVYYDATFIKEDEAAA